jgi:hypothetical protein
MDHQITPPCWGGCCLHPAMGLGMVKVPKEFLLGKCKGKSQQERRPPKSHVRVAQSWRMAACLRVCPKPSTSTPPSRGKGWCG